MNKTLSISAITAFFAIAITISSCEKGPLLIPYTLGDLDTCLVGNPYQGYQVFSFHISHDDIVAVLNAAGVTDFGKVNSVKLKKLKVAIDAGGVANFDEITAVEVYYRLPTESGDGDQIAYINNMGDGLLEAELTLHGKDMKQLLTEDIVLTAKVLNEPTGNSAVCFKLTEGIIQMEVKR